MAAVVQAPEGLLYNLLGVKLYHNGTVDRSEYNTRSIEVAPNSDQPVHGALSRDVIIDTTTHIWVRLYVPASTCSLAQGQKLPIILYFHGGGFVICSAATGFIHELCCKLSSKIGAVVVSLDYRLAPEHRLPAAFNDGLSAVNWLRRQAILMGKTHDKTKEQDDAGFRVDPWLSEYGDFSKCFMMGHSAGGLLVHQTATRALSGDGFNPLKVRGLILGIPFFAGIERTRSETEYGDSESMRVSDTLLAMALPEGADRSHPYCGFRPSEAKDLVSIGKFPPSLVVVEDKDPSHDRQMEYVEFLREAGNEVMVLEYKEHGHMAMLKYPEVGTQEDVEEAYLSLQRFMRTCLVDQATS